MKLGIVSGRLEEVQVQLTLSNYLELWEKEKGGGTIEWVHLLAYQIDEKDLEAYDIVFFIRANSLKCFYLMMGCKMKGITTVYILDDNWFCDALPYTLQCFKQCLLASDYVFVYNEWVYEEARRYHSNVYLFEPNVQLNDFERIERTTQEIRIGFAGSESKREYFQGAFEALEKIMDERCDVELYFKGIYLPLAFSKYGTRIHEENYVNSYKQYAQAISKWGCDIMISPLDQNEYTKGKCPNKYLEITAVGAAGIYSDTDVYRKYVADGKTGRITKNTKEGWYHALKTLIHDEAQRTAIRKAAYEDVQAHYNPAHLLPTFQQILRHISVEKSR